MADRLLGGVLAAALILGNLWEHLFELGDDLGDGPFLAEKKHHQEYIPGQPGSSSRHFGVTLRSWLG